MARVMTCHCGAVFSDSGTEALVEPVFAHFEAAHPDFGLSRVSVRNYLESEDRSTGSAQRLEDIGQVEIVPITPDRADDVIRLFDRDAFPDNPAWGSCYCMYYFLGGGDNPSWGHIPWQELRQNQHSRIEAGITTGTLAYVEGRLAGWCNATARSQFPTHAEGEGDDTVCSVVCFVIAPPYRGHGLATKLLDGAVGEARRRGLAMMEAYPRRDPQSAASAYVGALDMYLKAGFEITTEDPLMVRLAL